MSPEMHERIVWKSLRAERPGTTRQIYQAGNSGDVVVETDGAEYKDGVLYRVTTAPPRPALPETRATFWRRRSMNL